MVKVVERVLLCLIVHLLLVLIAGTTSHASMPSNEHSVLGSSCPDGHGWVQLRVPKYDEVTDSETSLRDSPRVLSVAVGWDASGHLYLGGRYALHRTTDCGATWDAVWESERLPQGGRRAQSPFQLAAARGGRLYFTSVWPQNMLISDDGGASWREGNFAGTVGALVAARSDPDVLYAFGVYTGGGSGTRPIIRRSTDGGSTWETRNLSKPDGDPVIDPTDALTLYTIGQGVVLRSVDGARSFTPYSVYHHSDIPVGASIAQLGVGRAAISIDGSKMWFLSVDGRFFRGTERGTVWEQLPEVPFGSTVVSVAASPLDPKVLFAVVRGTELWAYREPSSESERTP